MSITDVVNRIRSERYGDADVVFLAGSIVRGEGSLFSDLDLVVVYTRLACAYRESFRFAGYPVEAFVHDPETLEYFFMEVAFTDLFAHGNQEPVIRLAESLRRRLRGWSSGR
jgi:predicted nucleotidyltransferase